jgi:transposase-like protein
MSRKAVDVSLQQVYELSEPQAMDFLVKIRFGSWRTIRCSSCGSIGKHFWSTARRRWKCVGCGGTFTITSGTVFAYRKLPLPKIIQAALLWVNSAGGQPALELKRHLNVTYNTAFVWEQKLREGLVRGFNVGLLGGDIEMDGAHQSGRRSAEKRGKPQGSAAARMTSATPVAQVNAALLTGVAQAKARQARNRAKQNGEDVPRDDFGRELPADRRILITVRKRSGIRKYGAVATRVAIARTESEAAIRSVVGNFVAPAESTLNTDTGGSYIGVGSEFLSHRTVEHGLTFSGVNGENNNQAEEINFRFDRKEKGTHLNIEPKYMLEYAVEAAFRADTRRIPNGDQLRRVLHLAGAVGRSQFWQGYTRGKHRTEELSVPAALPAKPSGPKKGYDPRVNRRPPR